MSGPPIEMPAGYLPATALAYATPDGRGALISAASPLPVAAAIRAAASAALADTTSVSVVAGPFTPDLARPIWLTLTGSWAGSAALLRSTDGGATRLPATLAGAALGWTANLNEAVAEESCAGATWYLAITLTAGTLTYRVAQ